MEISQLRLRSLLAASGAGKVADLSRMVTFVYPRDRRWYAVDTPKHPAPMIAICASFWTSTFVDSISLL